MPETLLMMEFQITQEYLGQGTNLACLAPMYKETLDVDTSTKGQGYTVAKVVDGSLEGHQLSAIALTGTGPAIILPNPTGTLAGLPGTTPFPPRP